MRTLVDAKADVNASMSNGGGTALILASTNGHEAVGRALLDAKADANASLSKGGSTALILASAKGNEEIVRALLDANADVNAKTDNGFTALQWAEKNERWKVVRLLKRVGTSR